MFGLDLGKYRTIVISIALFLVLDLGVLVLNFVISSEIDRDAVNINLAGRQRMLSQRMAKTALQIETRAATGIPFEKEAKELQQAHSTFDSTLSAFIGGGTTLSGAGTAIQIERIDDAKSQEILAEAKALWTPYSATVKTTIEKGAASTEGSAAMARQAESVNLGLLKLMNDLTSRIEQLSSAKATTLRAVQVAGITLATLNFLLILFHFLRHLRESDRLVERARRETDNILQTTQEGLFLLDHDCRIGSQHSRALTDIIGTKELADRNFLDVLKPMVTEKTLTTTREYLELLLKRDVKEKLIGSLNPLNCVEIHLNKGAGEVTTHYLQFGFNRVREDERITHLLVTANDITRRIRLEHELKVTEERARGQMGMLVEIFQVEPSDMHRFLQTAGDGLHYINAQLMDQAETRPTEKVNAIYRIAHRLKGDAAALGLSILSRSFHELEDVLSGLRERSALAGEDFLPITVHLKSLFEQMEAVSGAVTRIAQMRGVVTVEPPRPQHDAPAALPRVVSQWQAFAAQIAQRQGKQVELTYSGIDLQNLAPALRDGIGSIVAQFVRNAVVHGIEPPAERKQRGKSEAGRLSVYVSQRDDGGADLSFRDDGQGISINKIREAAVRTGRLGAEEATALDPRRIAALIFEPGMSTSELVDEDAGRGAGLDAVRDLITRLGGTVRIGSTPGEYCHFRVSLAAQPEPVPFHAAASTGRQLESMT
jgi:signal transduction histidine kinase